jgi:hypothetical protein
VPSDAAEKRNSVLPPAQVGKSLCPWKRVLVSVAIGCLSAVCCWLLHLEPRAVDFGWSLRAAHDLLTGEDPYNHAVTPESIPYPLPAAAFAFPFLGVRKTELAGALFFGVSSALLAFGLTRTAYTRLLVFLAFPYWMSMMTVQWSPLIMAGAFLPWLLPAVLAKPQIGLPIALTHLSWRGFLACASLAAVSLVAAPRWPMRWISQIGGFQHYIPLFVFPGALLLLVLWTRHADAHLLLLTALMPQHWFYDCFILWLIPKTTSELLTTVCLSWGVVLWWPFRVASSFPTESGSMAVTWFYLPMLGILLVRRGAGLVRRNQGLECRAPEPIED